MGMSLAEIVANLPQEEREAVLAGMDPDALLYDGSFWLRPEQKTPPGDWNVHLVLAGRGWGKTRMAAEFIKEQAADLSEGPKRMAVVTRAAADARDVMIEGDSGLMSLYPEGSRPHYEVTKRRVTWDNGATLTTFSAEEPSLLRGPQFHVAVGDEIAAWKQTPDDSGLTAWDNLKIATRLGRRPRILLTTTPKRVPLLYDLIRRHEANPNDVLLTKGKTSDNRANLADSYLSDIYGIYQGTSLAAQELEGEMLDEVDGAVWTYETINENRAKTVERDMVLRVVAVDPSVAENPTAECGIVVVGSTAERDLYKRRAWVLDDYSIKGSPNVWAKQVVAAARKYGCPVVAEVNQGGALVRNAINQIDPSIKVYEVHSKQGKALRAEPVVLAYEQGRVKHYGVHGELESQMMGWIPGVSKYSPDRVDALVHGLTALLVKPTRGMAGGGVRAPRRAQGPRIQLKATRAPRGRIRP